MNEDNFILEDIDRELTFDEKVNKIVDEFNPEAVEYTADDNNGWSVKIKDKNSEMEFWVDVWVDTNYNDVETEWNQYIFDTNNDNDNLKNAVQENSSVFDLATSEAINYLQEQNIIEQDDKANWYVVYHTPENEFYEIYDEKFNTETGDIEGAGRIWNTDTNEEQEFVFTFDIKNNSISFNDFSTGSELDIKNDSLINEIKSFEDNHKDEISECVMVNENKNENFKQDYIQKIKSVTNEDDLSKILKTLANDDNVSDDDFDKIIEEQVIPKLVNEFNVDVEALADKGISSYEYVMRKYVDNIKIVESNGEGYKYNGYTFIPVGNVKSNFNVTDFIVWDKKLNSIFNADNGTYNYDELYKVLPSYDIFKIPELNDILVVPSSRYLFKFYGKPDKYVPVSEIPSEDELKTPDSDGYIGTIEDKEVIKDILDNDKDYMDISSKYGYCFNDYQLYNIATLYERADNTAKTKIEDVLENINYHSECSEIIDNASAFKSSLFENKKVTEDIDEEKTKIIFRKDKEDGDIIAVFPDDRQNDNMIGCYVHLGQHTTMSLDYYSKETIPATPEEYADLKKELESIGYNIEVVTELDESKIKKIETVDEENSLDDIANYIKGIVDYDVSITPTGKGFSSYDVNFLNTDGSIMYSVMVNDDAKKDKVRLLNTLVLELERLYRGKTFADIIREKLLDELNKIHPVSKKTEDVAINNGFDITKYQEIQNLADDIANSIKDKDNITIDNVIEAIENWDNGFSSVITALATADKNLANEIEKDEYDRYEAENQFLGLVEDTLNDMGITVYDEYDESKKVESRPDKEEAISNYYHKIERRLHIPEDGLKSKEEIIDYINKVDNAIGFIVISNSIRFPNDEINSNFNRYISIAANRLNNKYRWDNDGKYLDDEDPKLLEPMKKELIKLVQDFELDNYNELLNKLKESYKKTNGILKNIQKQDEIDEWEVFDAEIDKELGKDILDTFKNYEDDEDDVISNVRIDYNTDDGSYTVAYIDMFGGFHQIDYKLTDEELAELKGDIKTEDVTKNGLVEGNKIPRNWKKITYKAKVDTNLNNVGDTIEVERDEWNRPIMKNLRTGKTGQTFIDNLRNSDLAEIIDIKTEDATQCGAVDGGRVSIFGEKEKIEEDNEYFSYVASRDVKETLNDLLSGNYDIMYDYNVENFVDDLIDYLDTLDDSKAHSIAWELNQACISAEKSNRRASGTKPRKLIQALKSAKAYLDNIK